MKKRLIMAVLLAGAMCMTNNTAMATETESIVQSVQSMEQQGGYIFKGVWETVYVDGSKDQFTITIPAPSDNITGCAPGSFHLTNNGSTLTITGSLMKMGFHNPSSGDSLYFEIGGQQSNGDIVVYYVEVIIM